MNHQNYIGRSFLDSLEKICVCTKIIELDTGGVYIFYYNDPLCVEISIYSSDITNLKWIKTIYQ